MDDIKQIFGEGQISYSEFIERANGLGMKIGDIAEIESRYSKEMNDVIISNAVERMSERFRAKNSGIVKKALDMEAVKVENGKVIGLDEQFSSLMKSDPYLFRDSGGANSGDSANSTGGETVRGAKTGAEHGYSGIDADSLSDFDYYRSRFNI